jgi:hypothetical protein
MALADAVAEVKQIAVNGGRDVKTWTRLTATGLTHEHLSRRVHIAVAGADPIGGALLGITAWPGTGGVMVKLRDDRAGGLEAMHILTDTQEVLVW